jgi:hypothetical protein
MGAQASLPARLTRGAVGKKLEVACGETMQAGMPALHRTELDLLVSPVYLRSNFFIHNL